MLSRTWLLGRTSGLSTYSRQYTPKKVGWLSSIWSHPTHNYPSFRFREVGSANICNFKETNNLSQIMQWLDRYEGMRDRFSLKLSYFPTISGTYWVQMRAKRCFSEETHWQCALLSPYLKKYCAIPLPMTAHFSPHLWVWPFRAAINSFAFQLGWKTNSFSVYPGVELVATTPKNPCVDVWTALFTVWDLLW